jgi:hypothetical protein
MADKTATLSLRLRKSGFSDGLRDAENEAKRRGKSMGDAIGEGLKSGAKHGLGEVKNALSHIKGTILTLGGIAGGVGLAEMGKHALNAELQFKRLNFAIKAGTGKEFAGGYRALQKQIQSMAVETGQTTEDLAGSFQHLFTKTGDLSFTSSAIKDIAKASTASGHSMESLVEVVDGANGAFGITKEEVPDTLAGILSLSNKTGLSMEEFAAKLEMVGVHAKDLGLKGVKGFQATAGILGVADSALGGIRKGAPAVISLFDKLGNTAERNKAAMALGIDPKKLKGNAIDMIGQITAATRGDPKKLEKAFGGNEVKLLSALGESYARTFDDTKGSVKEKSAAAMEAFKASMEEVAKSGAAPADVNAAFADAMDTGQKKIEGALEKLKQSFTKPEVVAALEKLAAAMPAIADGFGKLVEFTTKSPLQAAALAGGGLFAKGMAGSIFEELIRGAFKGGAKDAAAEIAKGAGPSMASSFLGSLAGPALALAGGALAGAMLGALIEKQLDAQEAATEAGRREAANNGGTFDGKEWASVRNSQGDLEWKDANEINPDTVQWQDNEGNIASGADVDFDPAKGWKEVAGSGKSWKQSIADDAALADLLEGEAEAAEGKDANMAIADAAMRGGSGARRAPGGAGAAGGAPMGGNDAASARLIADMLGAKKLRVEITNPEAIRGGGIAGPSGPAPGNAPRP